MLKRVVLILVCLWGGYQAWQHFSAPTSVGASASVEQGSEAELRMLAAKVRADEVVMYSTSECGYCARAKAWLHQYGFAFTECNMSNDASCESAFRGYGAVGTPYLIVRGHHMKDGFDSDEFLAALRG